MIKIEKVVSPSTAQWERIIAGTRNPKNSWELSDSGIYVDHHEVYMKPLEWNIGPKDHKLLSSLAKGGPVHAKYRRMIPVFLDITAPLYWWKEFDTYKIGTVANSCSTMHKIHDKEFTLEDFSTDHLDILKSKRLLNDDGTLTNFDYTLPLNMVITALNTARKMFLETKDKRYWWQMIQLLPSSYNQKRTIMLNYEVLVGIYRDRKNHKLDEWHVFCEWIESLPYSELITGKFKTEPTVQICKRCKGSGYINIGDPAVGHNVYEICPDCVGRGLIEIIGGIENGTV